MFKQHREHMRAPTKPAADEAFTDKHGRLIEVSDDEAAEVKQLGYRKLIGCLLWPARNCYPAISYAVTELSRCVERPGLKAWQSALHTLHFLYTIRHDGIGYNSDEPEEIVCYYDSGHMQDRHDYRSQYGYVITMFGGPILWQSKKHQHVGESAAEDEYMALNHAHKQVLWLRNLVREARSPLKPVETASGYRETA